MTVHCRIMKIDIEKFSADLTCRTSDLMDRNNEWKLPKDTYYDFDAEAADHKQEEDMKRKQQRTSECPAGGLHLSSLYHRPRLQSCALAYQSVCPVSKLWDLET